MIQPSGKMAAAAIKHVPKRIIPHLALQNALPHWLGFIQYNRTTITTIRVHILK
jgi:hypothetical protein